MPLAALLVCAVWVRCLSLPVDDGHILLEYRNAAVSCIRSIDDRALVVVRGHCGHAA